MYLYFDNTGVLKEIINDVPLRQGSSNWNTIYVYWAGEINNTSRLRLFSQFVLPDNTFYISPETSIEYDIVNVEIPYDNSRDLKFFEYFKTYRMFKVIVPDEVLSMSGSVLVSFRLFENDVKILSLDSVPFYIDEISIGSIAPNEYLNIAQYNELLKMLAGKLDVYTQSVIVDELPEIGAPNTVYYVRGALSGKPYTVYMWDGSKYVYLGEITGDFASKEEQRAFEQRLIKLFQDYKESIEVEIDIIRESAISGGPKGVYNTLNDLQTANPNHDYFYLVKNNMHIYYWDATNQTWADAGPYSAPSTIQVSDRKIYLNDASIVLEDERLIVLEL